MKDRRKFSFLPVSLVSIKNTIPSTWAATRKIIIPTIPKRIIKGRRKARHRLIKKRVRNRVFRVRS
jgi:hypothetical protein